MPDVAPWWNFSFDSWKRVQEKRIWNPIFYTNIWSRELVHWTTPKSGLKIPIFKTTYQLNTRFLTHISNKYLTNRKPTLNISNAKWYLEEKKVNQTLENKPTFVIKNIRWCARWIIGVSLNLNVPEARSLDTERFVWRVTKRGVTHDIPDSKY